MGSPKYESRPKPHPGEYEPPTNQIRTQTRTRPEPDTNQTRTRHAPDTNQTRTRHEPRREPDTHQTRTQPRQHEPDTHQTRTRAFWAWACHPLYRLHSRDLYNQNRILEYTLLCLFREALNASFRNYSGSDCSNLYE